VFLKHKKSELIWPAHQIFITLHPEINNILSRDEKANREKSMKNLVKKACLSLTFLTLIPMVAEATDKGENKSSAAYDWSPVMEAIIKVESEGNSRAVSGNSVGAMQITPILVKECNEILKRRKSEKRYTMNDRYSVEKSKEMFLLIQSHHNKANSVEKAIRLWNGGPRYSIKGTNKYFHKVMRHLK
jgi:hypothetical protein